MLQRILADACELIGAGSIVAGTYLQFGLAFALIVFGLWAILLSVTLDVGRHRGEADA